MAWALPRLVPLCAALTALPLAASAQPLAIAEVDSVAFNCQLSPTCSVTVDDTSVPIVFPGFPGVGFLLSRTYTAQAVSALGSFELYFYEYRMDLRGIEGAGASCFDLFLLDTSIPPLTLTDLDGNGSADQVFVRSGGIGSYGPVFAHLFGTPARHVYQFGSLVMPPICDGSSSYSFGFASLFPPAPVQAFIASQIPETPILPLDARGPGLVIRPDLFAHLLALIAALDPDACVTGPTPRAREGRIGAMHNRVVEAESLAAAGFSEDASSVLANLLSKTDGIGADWVRPTPDPCADRLRNGVELAMFALSGEPLLATCEDCGR